MAPIDHPENLLGFVDGNAHEKQPQQKFSSFSAHSCGTDGAEERRKEQSWGQGVDDGTDPLSAAIFRNTVFQAERPNCLRGREPLGDADQGAEQGFAPMATALRESASSGSQMWWSGPGGQSKPPGAPFPAERSLTEVTGTTAGSVAGGSAASAMGGEAAVASARELLAGFAMRHNLAHEQLLEGRRGSDFLVDFKTRDDNLRPPQVKNSISGQTSASATTSSPSDAFVQLLLSDQMQALGASDPAPPVPNFPTESTISPFWGLEEPLTLRLPSNSAATAAGAGGTPGSLGQRSPKGTSPGEQMNSFASSVMNFSTTSADLPNDLMREWSALSSSQDIHHMGGMTPQNKQTLTDMLAALGAYPGPPLRQMSATEPLSQLAQLKLLSADAHSPLPVRAPALSYSAGSPQRFPDVDVAGLAHVDLVRHRSAMPAVNRECSPIGADNLMSPVPWRLFKVRPVGYTDDRHCFSFAYLLPGSSVLPSGQSPTQSQSMPLLAQSQRSPTSSGKCGCEWQASVQGGAVRVPF